MVDASPCNSAKNRSKFTLPKQLGPLRRRNWHITVVDLLSNGGRGFSENITFLS